MKFLTIIILILAIVSCDPRANTINPDPVSINAMIINPRDSIQIGDTVKVYFDVPDTIQFHNSSIPVVIGQNDVANTILRLYKIDTTKAGSIGVADSSIIISEIGNYTQYHVLEFAIVNNKLKGQIAFVLRKKGVYFIENQSYGFLQVNNGTIQSKMNFNYGAVNHNHQMLIDSAGPGSNFNLYIQDHVTYGLEIYGFRVK